MAEQKTMVIKGRMHVQTDSGLYRRVPLGMDEARSLKGQDVPDYAVADGKPFEVVNGKKYAQHLEQNGADSVFAEKSGGLIVRKAVDGEEIPVWSQNGILEATECGTLGKWVVTKADSNGQPVIDSYGHDNTYQMSDATLRKKYQVGKDVTDGAFVKPAGGEQRFLQVDRDVAFMVPWGKDGALIPQVIEKGGYMNVTSLDDVYGISNRDFADTYDVKRVVPGAEVQNTKTSAPVNNREIPYADTPAAEDDGFGLR